MEASLNSIIRLVLVVAGLVLMLPITPSWGQTPVCAAPGCNPTVTSAHDNTAGGSYTLISIDTTIFGAYFNTAFGSNALKDNTTGSHNTGVGALALINNTTGSYNTAIGDTALGSTHGGSYNTASGAGALSGTTGTYNTASGAFALNNDSTGWANTATGANALYANKLGIWNSAVGTNALYFNDTGNFNTAAGGQALYVNVSGSNNTALGVNALGANIIGNNNTAFGTNALLNSTGNKNIAIGFQAGINLTSGSNNVYLGSAGGDASEAQTVRIGKAQTRTFIAGIGNASVSGATVEIDTTTGQLGILTSSARYKQDIAPMGARSEKVLDLRPVTFAYKDDAQAVTHYGLIAEEVAAVYPDLVTHTATGEVQAVRYQELIPMLLNELQRQQQELAELRALMGQGRRAEAVIPSATAAANGTDSSAR